jgi:hypothetical protein
MQIRKITWPEGQPVGVVINLSGQIYKLVTSGAKDDPFPLMRWETHCATCGCRFYATSSISRLTQLNRRCPEHVDPTVPVPAGTFDENGMPFEIKKKVPRRNPGMTTAESEWRNLEVGAVMPKVGVKPDSVRRSCARWEKAIPGRKFIVEIRGDTPYVKRVV